MKLQDIATIRTGLVTSRKKALMFADKAYEYRLINLKSISDTGDIRDELFEKYISKESLKEDYLSQIGDIIVRLSAPYTVFMINKKQHTGLVIPSHFSIIRVDSGKVYPEYIYWILSRDSIKKRIMQNSSGSSTFGTISSGFFAEIKIKMLPVQNQVAIGQLFLLSKKESKLLTELSNQKLIYNRIKIDAFFRKAKREK